MSNRNQTLSVAEAAELCGVGHSTVGYWIRTQKLHADRVGRGYRVPAAELALLLKSRGHRVPPGLVGDNIKGPFFITMKNCWEYRDQNT